jgi:crossover junction endodeoxyribonuclease RuvC
MHSKECTIIGIDPGTTTMGYGLIKVVGQHIQVIQYGIIDLKHYKCHPEKLEKIFSYTQQILDEFRPQQAAIEAPFYGKNVQSMLKLGRAQGAAMAAVFTHQIPITEYAPARIKQAITGNGHASKDQVAYMLHTLLAFKVSFEKIDASDALAVAVCHAYQQQNPLQLATSLKNSIKRPSKLQSQP